MKIESPKEILQHYWGHPQFREPQEEIIEAILNKEDVLALLPTGGGKSVCFQIPALSIPGICIVISPLVALIKDQVTQLKNKGIKALSLVGGMSFDDVNTTLDNCINGNYKFLYLSPERLQQELVRARIQQMNVNLIAIDEAHCISQWGNDFRPAYLKCAEIKDFFPDTPLIALTATATTKVAQDIIDNLKIKNQKIIRKSFFRPNIAYQIQHHEDKIHKLKQYALGTSGSIIIYVNNRKTTKELYDILSLQGTSVTFFHGGLSNKEKIERLAQWSSNEKKVIVATNAFGMGIDKPDVRLVIHYHIPDSIENYFQEAGRAGRDGKKAIAILLKNNTDETQLKKQFLGGLPTVEFTKLLYRKLNSYLLIAYGEGKLQPYFLNFNSFCNAYKFNSRMVYNGLKLLDRNTVITLSESFNKRTEIQFITAGQALFYYLDRNPKIETIVKSILRSYGGIFDFTTKINTYFIAKKNGISEDAVFKILETLEKDGIINYQAHTTDIEINFLVPREDDKTINIFAKSIVQDLKTKTDRITQMLNFVNDTEICKNKLLLSYFGEKEITDCGNCSSCDTKKKENPTLKGIVKEAIVKLLQKGACNSRELVKIVTYKETLVLTCLSELLNADIIKINTKNQYYIH